MSPPPSPFQWVTSTHRPDPTSRLVPVAGGKTAYLLIRFLIEFLPQFLRLVNPCTGLWADDWRVITSCWHVCFLWAPPLILLTAKAAKSFCWSISPPCSAPLSLLPSVSLPYLLPPITSPFLVPQPSLFFPLSLYPCIWANITPQRELKEWEYSAKNKINKRAMLYFLVRMKQKGMGPFLHFVIIFCTGLSSVASVRAGAKLNSFILWGHILIKQPADNSNYLSVASAPHWGHTVRERSASSPACTSKRLILFLIRAHPEWYTKCSLPSILLASFLLCFSASLSSLY